MWVIMLMAALLMGVALDAGGVSATDETGGDAPEPDTDQPDTMDLGSVMDPDNGSDDDDDAPSNEPGMLQSVLRGDEEPVTGTDGNDLFILDNTLDAEEIEAGRSVTLDAGAGNDSILLVDDDVTYALDRGGSVNGGAGDDLIRTSGTSLTLEGGAGDDTIESSEGGLLLDSTVRGGEGNDTIIVTSVSSGETEIQGNAGEDVIDLRGSSNTVGFGGDGDDTIHTGALDAVGTGYVSGSDGGAGDDVLMQDVEVFPEGLRGIDLVPMTMTGGEGSDTFQLVTTGGDGAFTPSDSDPEVFSTEWINVTDFEAGTDMVVFDLTTLSNGYAAVSGEITEDSETGESLVTVRLESDTLPDQDIVARVSGTDISWDDVRFIGAAPELTPLADAVAG